MTTIIMMTRLSKGPLSEKLQALLQKLRHMQFPMLMRTEPPSDKLQALLRKLRNTTASLSWTWLCERLSMAWPNIISPKRTFKEQTAHAHGWSGWVGMCHQSWRAQIQQKFWLRFCCMQHGAWSEVTVCLGPSSCRSLSL